MRNISILTEYEYFWMPDTRGYQSGNHIKRKPGVKRENKSKL